MTAATIHEHVRPRPRWLSLALVIALLATTFAVWETVSASEAEASHFRSTQLSWEVLETDPDDGVTVRFTSTVAARESFYSGSQSVGSTVRPVSTIRLGDGNSVSSLDHEVIVADAANDWILMEATFEHTYEERKEYTAYWSQCCRLRSGDGHINNANANNRIETFLDLSGDPADPVPATNSPVSLISPIVDCPFEAVCSFTVPAIDAQDGAALNWRFATPSEATGGSGFVQPGPPDADVAAVIASGNGRYTWDTTGAATSTRSDTTLYSTQVVVEKSIDGVIVATTAVDFFIRLGEVDGNQAPTFIAPTPADGTVVGVVPGAELSFDVAADDPDADDVVTLSILNAPTDSFSSTPGNPATGTFTWTPPNTSSRLLTLRAQDDRGLEATARSLTIITADVANLAMEPATAEVPIGTDHIVTATATSAGGTTLAGADVTFEVVAGPNTGTTQTVTTDGTGRATFTYTGATVGDDTITASTAGATDPVAATDVTVAWVDPSAEPDDGPTDPPVIPFPDDDEPEADDPDEEADDPEDPTPDPVEPDPVDEPEVPDEPTDDVDVLDEVQDDETEDTDDVEPETEQVEPTTEKVQPTTEKAPAAAATPIRTQPTYTG